MSFGCTLILPDGVLLAADGRRTLPFVKNSTESDDVRKIRLIADGRAALIEFGVTQASELASRDIANIWPDVSDMKAFRDMLTNTVSRSWEQFVLSLADDVDRSHPAMRMGLMVAGILDGRPFTAGILHGFDAWDCQISTECGQLMTLGGEQHNMRSNVIGDFQKVLNPNPYSLEQGPINSSIQSFLTVLSRRIDWLSLHDDTVGGQKRYAIIRRHFETTEGELD